MGLHFFLGKKDLGFEWLEHSYDEQDYALLSISARGTSTS
jgi:hypothetical protein